MVHAVSGLGFMEHIKQTDREALKKVSEFKKAWRQIRRDKTPKQASHLKSLARVLDYFNSDFVDHIESEERVLFPYIKKHFPRLEYITYALSAEHDDFRRDIQWVNYAVHKISKIRAAHQKREIIAKLDDTVVYLIYLLRHHIRVESREIYDVLSKELTLNEKLNLQRDFQFNQTDFRHASLPGLRTSGG